MNTTNILIAGVGGQGILLASEILSEVCLLAA
jgi:indolepyruvate ferredoxin oxidoreductase, beta subunit